MKSFSKKPNSSTSILLLTLAIVSICIFTISLRIPYESSSLTEKILRFYIFPLLCLSLSYLFYVRTDAKLVIGINKILGLEVANSFAGKLPKWVWALMISTIIACMLKCTLVVTGGYFANEQVTKMAIVKDVYCHQNRNIFRRYTILTLVDNQNKQLVLNFPYNLCEKYPEIQKKDYAVKLVGHSSPFGTWYKMDPRSSNLRG